MATISVSDDVYDRLAREATARQTTVDQLVDPMLRNIAPAGWSPAPRRLSYAESKQVVASMPPAPPDVAHLPESFSREDIYFDHD